MLPYSPPFALWQDAYDYLLPINGLKRGSRIFWREHTGAVSVGADQELYAANKHFVYVIVLHAHDFYEIHKNKFIEFIKIEFIFFQCFIRTEKSFNAYKHYIKFGVH